MTFSLRERVFGVLTLTAILALAMIASSFVAVAAPSDKRPVEKYIPAIAYNDGYYSTLGITTTDTVTTSGLTATGAVTISGAASFTNTFAASTGSFGGLLTLNAGQLQSYTNSTSTTATSFTMVQADILSYDTLLITPNTASLTYTLPATSTLTSLVPTAGDMAEQCWYNATSTAGITVTVAEGTGWDLEAASSTTSGADPSFAIGATNTGCFKFIRKTNTDILGLFTRFADN